MPERLVTNSKLAYIIKDYDKNPLDEQGLYVNEYSPFKNRFKDFILWQKERKPSQKEKNNIVFKAPTMCGNAFFDTSNDSILWLGHASFLIRINGVTIITDPIFGSPSFLMKRLSELPVSLNLIKNIDYILISHDHRDHVDKKSLQLVCKQNPRAKILTGLSMEGLLKPMVMGCEIEEAGWYQQYNTGNDLLQIIYLPARHWGRRNLKDTNKRLWGSYIITNGSKTIYFGADSGYDKHFQMIGQLFPNIDVAMLGIGAYKPEWFMEQSHTSPEKALLAAKDLGCKSLIPMHYHTFDLSDEFMDEPLKEIKKLYGSNSFPFRLEAIVIGEVIAY